MEKNLLKLLIAMSLVLIVVGGASATGPVVSASKLCALANSQDSIVFAISGCSLPPAVSTQLSIPGTPMPGSGMGAWNVVFTSSTAGKEIVSVSCGGDPTYVELMWAGAGGGGCDEE